MQPSTLSSWALLLWQALRERGIDPAPIFRKADLDPAILSKNMARYYSDKLYALWDAALAATNDELIGIDVGMRWNATTLQSLGFAWLASTSLHDGIARLSRYAKLIDNALNIELKPEQGNYRLSVNWHAADFIIHPCDRDASHVCTLKMCRALLGDSFSPMALSSSLPRNNATSALEDIFGTHIETNTETGKNEDYWVINYADMHRSLATGNEELIQLNEGIALKYLAELEKQDIIANIRYILMKALPSGKFSEQAIAEKLHISQRTLQRKVAAEKQSFSNIVNTLRKELALNYIKQGTISLTEITYLLGFSEQASFTRAFKRWYNVAPSRYLEQQVHATVN